PLGAAPAGHSLHGRDGRARRADRPGAGRWPGGPDAGRPRGRVGRADLRTPAAHQPGRQRRVVGGPPLRDPGADPRAAALLAGWAPGLGPCNKSLRGVRLLGFAGGLALVGPRGVLASRLVWAGVGVAFVLGVPNLVYQATHDWPQLAMSAAMAKNEGAGFRAA